MDTLLCNNHASFVLGMNPLYITTEWAGIMLPIQPHQRATALEVVVEALRFGNWFLLPLVEEKE